jgi:hypothetical protein
VVRTKFPPVFFFGGEISSLGDQKKRKEGSWGGGVLLILPRRIFFCKFRHIFVLRENCCHLVLIHVGDPCQLTYFRNLKNNNPWFLFVMNFRHVVKNILKKEYCGMNSFF